MKTKLIALTAVITVLSFPSQAQKKNNRQKFTVGIRAGVNFQTATWQRIKGDEPPMELITGFHAGVNAEIPIIKEFYVQPGVIYSTKGGKTKGDYKINTSYIEIPVNVLYKPALGKGTLLLGIGPYIAFGIEGKTQFKDLQEFDIKWGNSVDFIAYQQEPGMVLKRFDAGGNLLAGYEFSNKLSIQLNGQLGMANLHPELTPGPGNVRGKFKHRGFGISAGYRF